MWQHWQTLGSEISRPFEPCSTADYFMNPFPMMDPSFTLFDQSQYSSQIQQNHADPESFESWHSINMEGNAPDPGLSQETDSFPNQPVPFPIQQHPSGYSDPSNLMPFGLPHWSNEGLSPFNQPHFVAHPGDPNARMPIDPRYMLDTRINYPQPYGLYTLDPRLAMPHVNPLVQPAESVVVKETGRVKSSSTPNRIEGLRPRKKRD